MRASIFLAVVAVCGVGAGCATATQKSGEPAPAEGKARAPIALSWEERSRSDGSAVVVAHVTKKAALALPLSVRLEAPAGVTVVKGRGEWTIPADSAPGEATETYELSFAQPPAADLVLHVDGEATGLGVHLHAEYAFGRAAPVVPQPAATGPGAAKGGQETGPSIPLDGK